MTCIESMFEKLQLSSDAMANPLRKYLPAEMRLKVFEFLCCDPWDGEMPNIIKALRPDPLLYFEALEVFITDRKCFVFHKANGFSFRDMSKQAVQSIRNITILVEEGIMDSGFWKVGGVEDEGNIRPADWATLSDAKNITSAVLKFAPIITRPESPSINYGGITFSFLYFLAKLKSLRRLELNIQLRPLQYAEHTVDTVVQRQERLEETIALGNQRFGTVGKPTMVMAHHQLHNNGFNQDKAEWAILHVPWIWEARVGETLLGPKLMSDVN